MDETEVQQNKLCSRGGGGHIYDIREKPAILCLRLSWPLAMKPLVNPTRVWLIEIDKVTKKLATNSIILANFASCDLSGNRAIVSKNLMPGRFVHFSTDDIDILDASHDGKEIFHATWVTAWHRGPPLHTDTFQNLKPSQKTLVVLDVIATTVPPNKIISSPEPKFGSDVQNIHFGTLNLKNQIHINY